jgi:hypothetical protein
MDFLDEAVLKAKELIDVACQKTGEVVNTSKQKIEILTLQKKLEKNYQALGEIYYEMIKDSPNEETAEIVADVKSLMEKLAEFKNQAGDETEKGENNE